MSTTISPEKMEVYRQSARAREAALRQAMIQRRALALSLAQQAARILKGDFGATRVVAFGSLAHGVWFSARSDIDLMAEGIAPDVFWRAWCALDPISGGFEIDLVAGEAVAGRLRDEIEREGIEL